MGKSWSILKDGHIFSLDLKFWLLRSHEVHIKDDILKILDIKPEMQKQKNENANSKLSKLI